MGRINRQDSILLTYNYSYLIQKKLRIFYLILKIFSDENFSDFIIPNILSNETFRFLEENKEYLKNNDNEELDISSNIIIDNKESEDENIIDSISIILDNQLENNDTILVNNSSFSTNITSSANIISLTNMTYQTSSNFLLSKTKTYPTIQDFNNTEHNIFKKLYK